MGVVQKVLVFRYELELLSVKALPRSWRTLLFSCESSVWNDEPCGFARANQSWSKESVAISFVANVLKLAPARDGRRAIHEDSVICVNVEKHSLLGIECVV